MLFSSTHAWLTTLTSLSLDVGDEVLTDRTQAVEALSMIFQCCPNLVLLEWVDPFRAETSEAQLESAFSQAVALEDFICRGTNTPLDICVAVASSCPRLRSLVSNIVVWGNYAERIFAVISEAQARKAPMTPLHLIQMRLQGRLDT